MNKQDEQWWKDMCGVFTECRKDYEKRVVFLKLAANMQTIATEIGRDR